MIKLPRKRAIPVCGFFVLFMSLTLNSLILVQQLVLQFTHTCVNDSGGLLNLNLTDTDVDSRPHSRVCCELKFTHKSTF